VTQLALASTAFEQLHDVQRPVDLCERIYLRNFHQHLSIQAEISQDWSRLLSQD